VKPRHNAKKDPEDRVAPINCPHSVKRRPPSPKKKKKKKKKKKGRRRRAARTTTGSDRTCTAD
jgi:hypothetical protein